MKTEKHISGIRRIIGDILIALVVLLTADVVIVMVDWNELVIELSK